MILTSYGSDLARKHGRRARQIVRSDSYAGIFGTTISPESSAADEWALTNGSEYMAGGILSGITGNRANGIVIDDPVKGRDEAESEIIRKRTLEAYEDDIKTRLLPGGWMILIQCMTGDTPVLMATGREKPLRDIRPGDQVATYENGAVSVSTIRNWINHGPDRVFEIRMQSGITVKANARHPFLVEEDGETQWTRTASLKKGSIILRVIGANGAASLVPQRDATNRPGARACACPTTTSTAGGSVFGRHLPILSLGARRICATAMGLISRNTKGFWPSRAEFALCASSHPRTRTPAPTGAINSASITATTAKWSGAFYVTIATLRSVMERPRKFFSRRLPTYEIARDTVVEVVESGVEDVFDIEVDRTANFIANGLVSHNTRWHGDDLAGSILPKDWGGESGLIRCRDGFDWNVVCLPAKCERLDDPLGRKPGEYLWPEWFDQQHWAQFEANPRTWSALYQQRPAPAEGDYFKAEWLRSYDRLPPLETLTIYGASDYAVTADGGDYTVHIIVGVDPLGRMYVVDLWRAQVTSDVWVETFCDLVLKWKPLEWAEETGQIKAGVGPFLTRRMRDRQARVYRRQFPVKHDKAVRAQSIRGRMAMDGLYLPTDAPWLAEFRRELLTFNAGVHDDQVDALGLIGQLLDHVRPGREVVTQKPRPTEPTYHGLPDGRIVANMSVFDIVEAKRRRKEREE